MKKNITVKVGYRGNYLTITSCKTVQAACRTAFAYWIREGLIKKQPKTDNDWPSSYEGVFTKCF